VFACSRLKDVEWSLGPVALGMRHFHVLVLVILIFDVAFRTYPRLMTTYGGF
jgi:hypothetical protein